MKFLSLGAGYTVLLTAAEAMLSKQVIRQTKARIFKGNTKVPDKVVSMFEPHTEVIRKGKASKFCGAQVSKVSLAVRV